MYKLADFTNISNTSCNKNVSLFMNLLKLKWDEIHEKPDVFRYKIHNMLEKVIDDKYLLQLNPNRGVKRRTPELIDNICQPFDGSKFNFTKVSSGEILFSLGDNSEDPELHSFLVNVSPISKYHALLCPSVKKQLPQVVTSDSLRLAIDVMFLASDRDLRIGFNSLCAFASVNHLHYHLLMESSTLPVEEVDWKHINGRLYRLAESYVAPAFCFSVEKHSTDIASKEIYKIFDNFLKQSIAHNILITMRSKTVDDNVKVIIWPRKRTSGVKQTTGFNVAVCELSGWFPIYNEESYANLTTEDLENELAKWVIDDFDQLCRQIKCLF